MTWSPSPKSLMFGLWKPKGFCVISLRGAARRAKPHSSNGGHTWEELMPISAFLTDASLCIGCKACEVACKEWNEVPDDGFSWSGNSYDNTRALGASTWRHVLFLEQKHPMVSQLDRINEPFRWQF